LELTNQHLCWETIWKFFIVIAYLILTNHYLSEGLSIIRDRRHKAEIRNTVVEKKHNNKTKMEVSMKTKKHRVD